MEDYVFQRAFRLEFHDELLTRGWGTTIYPETIVITEGPVRDEEALSLLKDGILEHPTTLHSLDRLIDVWSMSGYNEAKPEEKVEHLLVGEYGKGYRRFIPPFIRLGIRKEHQWIYLSKEVKRQNPLML